MFFCMLGGIPWKKSPPILETSQTAFHWSRHDLHRNIIFFFKQKKEPSIGIGVKFSCFFEKKMCSVHQAWRRQSPVSEGRARKMKKEIIINIWAQFLRDDIWPLKGPVLPRNTRFAKRKPFPKNVGGKKAIRENKNMGNFLSNGWWIVMFHPFSRAYLSFWRGRHKLETLSVTCHLARWWTATFCRMGNQQLYIQIPHKSRH